MQFYRFDHDEPHVNTCVTGIKIYVCVCVCVCVRAHLARCFNRFITTQS